MAKQEDEAPEFKDKDPNARRLFRQMKREIDYKNARKLGPISRLVDPAVSLPEWIKLYKPQHL